MKTATSISKEAYAKYMEVVQDHCGDKFLKLYVEHVRYFNGDFNLAGVLGHILNLLNMKDKNARDRKELIKNEMWVRCPVKDITKRYNMHKSKVIRLLQKLADGTTKTLKNGAKEKVSGYEILETKHGLKNVLFVRVDVEKLNDNITGVRGQNEKSYFRTSSARSPKIGPSEVLKQDFSTNKNLSKDPPSEGRGRSASPSPPPKNERNGKAKVPVSKKRKPSSTKNFLKTKKPTYNPVHLELAKKIKKASEEKGGIPIQEDIYAWSNCLSKFIQGMAELNKDEPAVMKRIEEDISWYSKNRIVSSTGVELIFNSSKQFTPQNFKWIEDDKNRVSSRRNGKTYTKGGSLYIDNPW